MPNPTPTATELVTEIQAELKRLNRLINDISSTSRLDAELARQEMQPIDIRTVLGERQRPVCRHARGRQPSDRLFVEPATSSSYTVRGNDGRLGQVFTNLIDNALSFSPEGGNVTVRAQPNGSKIEIAIEDEGPGIPPDKLGQIFDRFYSDRPQTDSKTRKEFRTWPVDLARNRRQPQRRDFRRKPRDRATDIRHEARASPFACRLSAASRSRTCLDEVERVHATAIAIGGRGVADPRTFRVRKVRSRP